MIFTFEPSLDGRLLSQNLCDVVFVSVPVSYSENASSAAGNASCLPTRKSGPPQERGQMV